MTKRSEYTDNLPTTVLCAECGGEGEVAMQRDGQPVVCGACGGTGEVVAP